MKTYICDFETASRVNLSKSTSHRYASHTSTHVLCMAYRSLDGNTGLWVPSEPYPFEGEDVIIYAHNAEFEFNIWNLTCCRLYGWPELDINKLYCTSAAASYVGLPRGLSNISKVLNLGDFGKNDAGHRVMKRLCRPQLSDSKVKEANGIFHGGDFDRAKAKLQAVYDYCKQDVAAEHEVFKECGDLPVTERTIWKAHVAINRRGIPVDLDFCRNANKMVELENEVMCSKISHLTDGKVTAPTQLKKLKEWLADLGVKATSLDQEHLTALLEDDSVPGLAKSALRIRMLSRDSAVAKYPTMMSSADEDGRCRNAHIYYKAGTGRWAGVGVNFLNLRHFGPYPMDWQLDIADRISAASDDDLPDLMQELTEKGSGVIPTLGHMIRLAVCARDGYKLLVRDYKAIEMRVLHWLAGDEAVLDQIYKFDRGIGEEPYRLAAARIYEKKVGDITKEERTVGKVQILGCGYLSGAPKFRAYCQNYGLDISLELAQRVVQDYRRANPAITKFWKDLERSAISAVNSPGRPYKCGKVCWQVKDNILKCRLPSGRLLHYRSPSLRNGAFGKEIMVVDRRSGSKTALSLPILVENVDQAVSRDLLADALVKCEKHGIPTVLHVYDEIVAEVPEKSYGYGEKLSFIMRDQPDWATDLPIEVDGGEHKRYVK